jgi:hypothetical protein
MKFLADFGLSDLNFSPNRKTEKKSKCLLFQVKYHHFVNEGTFKSFFKDKKVTEVTKQYK